MMPAGYVNARTRLVVEGKTPVGRPRKTWQKTVSADRRHGTCTTERNGGP